MPYLYLFIAKVQQQQRFVQLHAVKIDVESLKINVDKETNEGTKWRSTMPEGQVSKKLTVLQIKR